MNQIQHKHVHFQHLGLVDYQQAWDYQEKLFADTVQTKIENRKRPEDSQEPTANYLLFCQHPHVYTLGKSGHLDHLLLSEQQLAEKKAKFYKINRGGDITYHGPGQLVAYPILDLENFFTDIHRYLRYLEEAVILTLADFGLEAGRIEGLTGVWLDHIRQERPRKICAMGVKSSRWVTMHGLALNVNADLRYFEYIIPCGINDKAVTSMQQELGSPLEIRAVESSLRQHLAAMFEMELGDEQLGFPAHNKATL
jgi:lipoyl(octanoyl) transferase